MAKLSFLWHLHQPAYRTADGVAHAPWTLLHAGGSYATLARAILAGDGRGQVLNIVPILLEQLLAYADGSVDDPVVTAVTTPASDLDPDTSTLILDWAFHVTPRQLERFPRLRELASRKAATVGSDRSAAGFGPADLRDLQVLFILAQAGEQAWADERLAPLYAKGRAFTSADHVLACQWLLLQPAELIELWHRVSSLAGAEIATSPYAHPIMPLLSNTSVVAESWAPHPPPPDVPAFNHPEDARWQLETGLRMMRSNGFEIGGCWPPEGSVSAAAVDIYDQAGVRWLVTDEGILSRSLDQPIRTGDAPAAELYSPWRLADRGPVLFFRDRWLSDRIGFVYGHWEDERLAARDMVTHLEGLARALPEEATIVIALDGENPWLHYPNGGGPFLRELMERLAHTSDNLHPTTLTRMAAECAPRHLDRLHPGSWINSIFATWIGHPEKTRAWRVLAAVREAIAGSATPQPHSLLLAEGSDWFWWLGDDNPTPLAPLYDQIFRRHLADACDQAGVAPPVDLQQPLKTVTLPVRVPISRQWPEPVLDGDITSYFEWSIAGWVKTEGEQPLERLALWSDGKQLFVLLEGRSSIAEQSASLPIRLRLQSPAGEITVYDVEAEKPHPESIRVALGRVAEMAVPWRPEPGWRLEVGLGPYRLPAGGSLVLEPFDVDEGAVDSVRASI